MFIPLIDEIDTMEPGPPVDLISAATAWLMKNIVSRLAANNARQSPRLTRVAGIHVDGAAPPATLTNPYTRPSARRTASRAVAMPSSVDTSAATGTIGRPSATSGPMCSSRLSADRLTATTVAPALGHHAGDGRTDSAAAGARHHHDAAVETQQIRHKSLSLAVGPDKN